MNEIEKLIFSYTEMIRILRENKEKDNSSLSVALRDKVIETYEQVIFDLERIKNLPNELRAVNRNEQAKEVCDRCNEYNMFAKKPAHCKYCGDRLIT